MTIENQDDNFVILQEAEISESKHEALNTIRFGNNSLDKQFKRDIELISLAIVQCGQSEQDKIKADILLKSMLLLFFGQIGYRHSSDQRFYPFDTLNTYFKYSTLTHFPIAALLLHGSRVLIEFPLEIACQLMDWLIIDKSSWRYLATHGISALTVAEVISKNFKYSTTAYPIHKCLKEEKVSGAHAAINLLSNSISGLMSNAYFNFSMLPASQDKLNIPEHYGIDLALGGVGNQHFVSKKIIQNNGEHGHLYINFYQGAAQKNHSGLLLGIEQSAPGKSDQYGGTHDLSASDKAYSASGGDFFCKKPILLEIYQKDYRGLTILPFANYYDSFWNFITEDTFALIKTNFEKCKCLLSLLAKEKSHAFIKHVLAAPGGASQEDFDKLFNRYLQEIPQVKVKANPPLSAKDKLKTLQQHIQSLKKDNRTLLINLSQSFMQCVMYQMGWLAAKSQKKKILLALQQRTQIEGLNLEQLTNLLKNFISVSLMNRYYFKGATHTAKACLTQLSLPRYQSLTALLGIDYNVHYQDLLDLVSDTKTKKDYFTSAKYKKNLYRFYQEEGSKKNQLADDKLNLATQRIVYAL